MTRFFKRSALILAIGLSCLISILWGSVNIQGAYHQPIKTSEDELFIVLRGESLNGVLTKLSQQQVIDASIWLKIYTKLFLKDVHIHIGAYDLSSEDRLSDFIHRLAAGEVKQFQIKLVEGLRWQDWKSIILTHPAIINDFDENRLITKLALQGGSLEGWLLPDTYNITWQTSAMEFVERLYNAMQGYLQMQWEQRLPMLPIDTPYEALILASIIEKETGLASERARIAGVFSNRLEQGMRLQTDPTVIYGLGDEFDGDLTRKHLRAHSDYNTYVINGLPPTPIAMPSKDAVKAALQPQTTEEIYFVAKGDGSHHFSVTLAEHNAAVRKYQLGME